MKTIKDKDTFNEVCAYIQSHYPEPFYYIFVLVVAWYWLSLEYIVNIKISDFYIADKRMQLSHPPNSTAAIVPICIKYDLMNYIKDRDSNSKVFVKPNGTVMVPEYFSSALIKIKKELDIPDLNCSELRKLDKYLPTYIIPKQSMMVREDTVPYNSQSDTTNHLYTYYRNYVEVDLLTSMEAIKKKIGLLSEGNYSLHSSSVKQLRDLVSQLNNLLDSIPDDSGKDS